MFTQAIINLTDRNCFLIAHEQMVDQRTEDFLSDMEKKSQNLTTNHPGGGVTDNNAPVNGSFTAGVDDGDFGKFLMSMLDEAPIAHTYGGGDTFADTQNVTKKASMRSSYCDPNFRYAAPFLAGLVSYMERGNVPFEHCDVWTPSTVPSALQNEHKGGLESAPAMGEMGSGSNLADMGDGDNAGDIHRLCFAGSATSRVQVVEESGGKRVVSLTSDETFNFSLYGDYSSKFSFSTGCGLPGRVFQSGVAAWEQFLPNAPPDMFERRGGAIQFGINTALGLPIDSPNVGRIVVVLYSKYNREKDSGLVDRMVKDIKLFNPCPRWKLVVDVRSNSDAENLKTGGSTQPTTATMGIANSNPQLGMDLTEETASPMIAATRAPNGEDSNKNNQLVSLISLLQENMPSDQSSELGKHLNNMMSLRMILLRSNRSVEEEQLVDTMLVLFESYTAAGRSRADIALLVTRDYEFHVQHQKQLSVLNQPMAQQPQPSPIVLQASQQHLQSQHVLHNFNQAAHTTAAAAGALPTSFLPPSVQQQISGGAGGPLPILQNVLHPPYPQPLAQPRDGNVQFPMNSSTKDN